MNDIITGYENALKIAYETLEGSITDRISLIELADVKVPDVRDLAAVTAAITPVVCAKQYGHEKILAEAIASASLYTLAPEPAKPRIDVDNIRTVRLLGGSVDQTKMMPGMVLMNLPQNNVLHVEHAKVLVLTCGLEASSSETKGTVLIENAAQLLEFTRNEEEAFGNEIEAIAKTGVNVIFAGGSISEISRHYLNKFNIMGVSVGSKFDLRRICKTLNATALVRVGPPTAEEIGECASVDVMEVGGKRVTVLKQEGGNGRVATVVIRGSTENLMEDVERVVGEACCGAVMSRRRRERGEDAVHGPASRGGRGRRGDGDGGARDGGEREVHGVGPVRDEEGGRAAGS